MDDVARVDEARYLSLETRRRSGVWVATPVWFARHDDGWYVFSAGDAGKVKRLRHTDSVRVRGCDARGRTGPDWGNVVETTATLVTEPHESAAGYQALRTRYGWQMYMTDFWSRLFGRIQRRALIRIARPN